MGAALGQYKRSPGLALPEQGAGWNFQGLVGFPDDDLCFHPEIVADTASLVRRGEEVGHNIDSLLFNAKSRNFGEGGRLDQPDPRLEQFAAAPLFELDFASGLDGGTVAR